MIKRGVDSNHFKNLKGFIFGRLTVIEYKTKITKGGWLIHLWVCKCECGNYNEIRPYSLLNDKRKECDKCSLLTKAKKRILPNNKANINTVIRSYKDGARKRNIEFKLTNKNILNLIFKNCYYCNTPPKPTKRKQSFLRNGIDRVDNKKGYLIDNVVPCCETCNRCKLNLTHDEFLNTVKQIYNNLIKKI